MYLRKIGTSPWDEVSYITWTDEDDAFNLALDKFNIAEHIDMAALVDTRDFLLQIEPWEVEILKKRSKLNEKKLLHKYSGVKFCDKDDEVVGAFARTPTASHLTTPLLAGNRVHYLLGRPLVHV